MQMNSKKAVQSLFVVGAIFAALVHSSLAIAESADAFRDGPGGAVLDSSRQKEEGRPSSSLWRSHIWDAFPSERLSTPGDTVCIAYQQNGWKPFFIDSRFRLNEAGKLVLDRIGSLENEAIDPKPYMPDSLARAVLRLDRCREDLQTVDRSASDIAADSSLKEPPVEQSPNAPASGNIGGIRPGPGVNASMPERREGGDSLQRRDLVNKYNEAFKAAAELDTLLAAAYVLLAKEMNPSSDQARVKALLGEIPMAKALKDLEPDNYQVLVASYARYRNLAAHGQQQRVTHSATIRSGESGNHVRDLQKRLTQEGFYSGSISGVFDSATARAVKEFQAMHLIDPDGVVGPRTRDWLNVSFREKAGMIAYGMKSLRQSPTRTHERFVRINIPQFLLEYYNGGKVQVTHRVVVGKSGGKQVKFKGRMVGENQTPTLTSSIEQVILNPRWYVSDRIRLELDAEAKADPEWFSRHGYVQMASLHSWGQPRIFQRPGPNNALGRVKFEFPNVYAIYLHDTPKKHLFQRTRRDFSHGCIRVDKAIDFAQTLLSDDKSPHAQRLDSILKGQNQTFVRLSQPVPIAIEYIPVSTNGSGQVVFLGDPYGILKENSYPKG